RRFERQSYPDGQIPERKPTPLALRATTEPLPPRLDWVRYAVAAGVGVAAAGVLYVWLGASPFATSSAGAADGSPADAALTTIPDAAVTTIPASSVDAAATTIPASSVPVEPEDAGATDASAADGGVDKHHPRWCKPGTMVRMPNGLLKPCGL